MTRNYDDDELFLPGDTFDVGSHFIHQITILHVITCTAFSLYPFIPLFLHPITITVKTNDHRLYLLRFTSHSPRLLIKTSSHFPLPLPPSLLQAVYVLKSSPRLVLDVIRGAGLDLVAGESSGYNSSASSVAGDQTPPSSSSSEPRDSDHSVTNRYFWLLLFLLLLALSLLLPLYDQWDEIILSTSSLIT